MLGVMSLGSEPRFTPGFLDAALAAIREHDVQFLTGWFGDTAGQIGDLCQAAVAAGRHAACQPWRVAARGTTQSPLPEMQWPQSRRASGPGQFVVRVRMGEQEVSHPFWIHASPGMGQLYFSEDSETPADQRRGEL